MSTTTIAACQAHITILHASLARLTRDRAISSKPRLLAAATWRLQRALLIIAELVSEGAGDDDVRLRRKQGQAESEARIVDEISADMERDRMAYEQQKEGYERQIEELQRRMEELGGHFGGR